MSWKVNPKEFEAVIGLPASVRYDHFIKKVADFEELWGLKDEEGWSIAKDPDGCEVMLIWPHSKYAEAYIGEKLQNIKPAVITLDRWLDVWLPELEKEGRMVAVFPTSDKKGIVVSPQQLLKDLEEELENY